MAPFAVIAKSVGVSRSAPAAGPPAPPNPRVPLPASVEITPAVLILRTTSLSASQSRAWPAIVSMTLLIADRGNARIRRVDSPLAEAIEVASPVGREVCIFDDNGRHLRTDDARTGSTLRTFTYTAEGLLHEIVDGDGNTTTIQRAGVVPQAIVAPFGQTTTLTLDQGYLASVENPAGESVSFTYFGGGLLESMTGAETNTWNFMYDAQGRLEENQDPAGGLKTLLRNERLDGYQIDFSTAVNIGVTRQTRYEMRTLGNGDRERTVIHPDGTQTVTITRPNGQEETQLPNGDVRLVTESPDPRFGMESPVIRTEIEMPSELTSVVETSRTAEDSTTYTDVTTLNDEEDSFSFTLAHPRRSRLCRRRIGSRSPKWMRKAALHAPK